MVAATLVAVTGSSGTADVSAEPRPFKADFRPERGAAKPAYDAKSVIVQFKAKATTSARKAALAKVKGKSDVSVTSDIVTVTGEGTAPDLLKKVKSDPAVAQASLNYIRRKTATPNDWLYANYQKYLPTVRVNQAWDLSKSAGTQTVAVLDTGVDAGHPDLAGHLLPGYNTFNTALPPNDGDGHGTAVTGIIAAGTSNTIGIAGVAWNAKVRPVKVLDDNGEGSDANLINGINWAVKNGARVINMSLGSSESNPVLHTAIQNAVAKGVVLVASSGNTGLSAPHYPSGYPEVLSVGATNWYGALTDFSTYGDSVDIAAPGFDITSTAPRAKTPAGYDPYWLGLSGTSFSSPIVAGVAALVRSKWPTLTPAQVMARLKATARDAGPRGIDPYYGAGILDAYQALGGRWTTDFPVVRPDPYDQPAPARALTTPYSSTFNVEGDVDWYSVWSTAPRNLKVSLTGSEFNLDLPVNIAPRIEVYNSDLEPLATAVNPFPANPAVPAPLTATANVSVAAGATYIAVRNNNGSRDTRQYTLSFTEEGPGGTTPGIAYPVRDVEPSDMTTYQLVTTKPVVTFARPVLATSVTPSTVRLVNGKTGSSVGATVAYDEATKKAELTPTAPLLDNAPYRIVVSGVQEAGGTPLAPFSSVFSTRDDPPAAPTFDATGAYLAATLTWKLAPLSDLDQVIVRRNAGNTVPTLTTGALVYAGTASAFKNTGLAQNTTYTYGAWVKDRTGNVSPVAVSRLWGVKTGIAMSTTLLNYGGSVTIKGSTIPANGVGSIIPVNLYVRPKNSTKFTLLATLNTSTTGNMSFVHKPLVSSVYMLTYPGNEDRMGTRTPDVTVQVAPTVSAALSPVSIRLGQLTKLSGYVAPAHYGAPVYLQQYGNKVWKSIASVKLSSSGAYAFGIKPAIRGQIAYRVWFPADADHAQAFSATKILTVG
ncbi:S8 family serine peptidase [Kribbella catacumbae]|uniref:S8 family serine peptidase n=1 Tax=Kribbella catacumbae TaxID=460086 RepID=UPI00035EC60D|nr:S8 family serine peptidase [Kribbella catacumbae]